MLTYRDFVSGLRKLEISQDTPVIAHASLSAFGEVNGGAETVLGALLSTWDTLVMPAFTFNTMIIPEAGPDDNAIAYGSEKDKNYMAEFYSLDMPVDRLVGRIPEALRRHPKARRSNHPLLSFTGINAREALQAQTVEEPLAPIGKLAGLNGWVLLLGVDHGVNTSIHYAEKLAGRKQFIRWALTPDGVVACPGYPGCSDGFTDIAPYVKAISRNVKVGQAVIQAIPLPGLIGTVEALLLADPMALLCRRSDCERCNAARLEASKTILV